MLMFVENQKTWRKTLEARERTKEQLYAHVTQSLGIKPGPQK
jgi:hypothetical protein